MLNTILNGAFLGVKGKIWSIILALVVAGVFVIIAVADNAVEDTLDVAKDAGRAEAVVAGQKTTLDQLEAANDAEDEIRFDRDNARYTACVRDAAPGFAASCERFRSAD